MQCKYRTLELSLWGILHAEANYPEVEKVIVLNTSNNAMDIMLHTCQPLHSKHVTNDYNLIIYVYSLYV